MRFYFKNSLLALFVFIGLLSQAQTGLNFQGVARNSNNVILASQPISLRLSIVQGTASGTVEYAETRKVTTNAQGLFNVVIGDTGTISVVGNFSAIDWKLTPKFLKIEMDVAAGSNFVTIGTTQFQSVAYAQFANQVDAEKINGVIPVAKGGTGVASITALKASLDIETKVDKVTGKDLSTNDYTTVEKTKLAAITGANTGDQDLSSYATNTSITLKENAANKSTATDLGSSTTSHILFPSQKAVKSYVDAQINSGGVQDGGILTRHLADGAVNGIKLASEISGYKKFINGAGSVTLSNTVTTDIEVNTGTLTVGGTSNWQSFTAGLSGKLTEVEFQTINPSSSGPAPIAYVEIYNDQGLAGSLLGTSASLSISGLGRNWYTFDFSSTNINLISGSIYTARLVVNTTNQNYVYGDNAIYNGGISNISSTWDLNIKTKIRQFNDDTFMTTGTANNLYGGLVTNATHTGEVTGATILTIVDGAVTSSKIATSAVDLTTKVSGQLATANIADGAVTSSKIATSAVDLTTKVSGQLATANIADGAVTSSKIATSAVDLTNKVSGVLPTTNGGTGTITANANTFFAAPDATSGAPSFRALVSADIPESLTTSSITNSGKVIVGASIASSASAVLEASSTTQGFLPPRMSYYQKTQIVSPVAGLTIWCINCGASGEMQVFNGGTWTNMVGGTALGIISLNIGNSYQGGKVAYILVSGDPGYDANTQHGLITATVDQSTGIRWYNGSNTTTGATGTAIGAGLSNTNSIIANQGGTSTSYAAGIARAYTGGGYNDWYLPSKDELNKLFSNRFLIGDFANNYYWSSTESDFIFSWYQHMADGRQLTNSKSSAYYVRAIRAF